MRGAFLSIVSSSLVCLSFGEASAEVWSFVGSRYQAMGGAGVAVVDDSLASYWNPAALAYMKGWDLQLPVTMNYSIENDALHDLGEILATADGLGSVIDAIDAGTPISNPDMITLLSALKNVPTLGVNGQSMAGNIAFGLTGHIGRIGIGALSHNNASVRPVYDRGAGVALSNAMSNILGGATPGLEMDTGLSGQIAGIGGITATEASQFVYLAEQAGFDTSDADQRQLLIDIATETDAATSTLNQGQALGADVRGLSTQEFGISYGHPLPVPFYEPLDRRIAVGGVLKYMVGVSYFTFVDYGAGDDVNDIIDEAFDFDNTRTSHDVGLDLGLLAQPWDWLRVGMVARNVNSPTFSRSGPGEFELEPQVRVGVAAMPIKHWIVATDIDLTNNSSLRVPGFDSRIWSLGTEYTLPIPIVTLILRAGGNVNVAEGQNNSFGLSGGVGLRFGNFLLDLSAGGAFDDEDFATSATSGESIPSRLNVGLNLSWQSRPEGTRRRTGQFDSVEAL